MKSITILLPLLLVSFLSLISNTVAATCSASTPCVGTPQPCCSLYGYCGTTSSYCGTGNCTANCWKGCQLGGSNKCAAGECCSQYGYCGTTADHCSPANNCFSNCWTSPSTPSLPSSSRVWVAYIPSWTQDFGSPCNLNINTLNVAKFTHLLIPFAGFDTTNFNLYAMNSDDTSGWYTKVKGLKSRNANLKVLISVGGGSFGGGPWATMVNSATNRNKFITNAINFARNNNFDGIDIDWEAPDTSALTAPIASFFSGLRSAITNDAASSGKPALLLTIASPNYAFAINIFNFPVIQQYLDWINMMNYDYYGPWSSSIGANTGFDSIQTTFAAFSGVAANKLVMGFANYATTFTLSSTSQHTPGSPFSGPGTAGSCSHTAGTLNYNEVATFISSHPSGTSVFDSSSNTPYFYSGNQWITYDNPQSLQTKINYLVAKGMRGAMVWELDGNDSITSVVATGLGL